MAALVKDAANNMHTEEGQLSHVVTQLAKSLPSEFYREWGRHAYSLLPSIPGLAEFGKWIEGVVNWSRRVLWGLLHPAAHLKLRHRHQL